MLAQWFRASVCSKNLNVHDYNFNFCNYFYVCVNCRCAPQGASLVGASGTGIAGHISDLIAGH